MGDGGRDGRGSERDAGDDAERRGGAATPPPHVPREPVHVDALAQDVDFAVGGDDSHGDDALHGEPPGAREASDASRQDRPHADAREDAGGHREAVTLRRLVHRPEERARGDRHRPRRRVARHGSHPAEVDEDRAVAHAQLGVPSAAQREGHAVAPVRGPVHPPSLGPETALDPRGDEANRQHDVALARGLERHWRSPSLVEARVIGRARRRQARVVSGRVWEVNAALGAETPEMRRDEVFEGSHRTRARRVARAWGRGRVEVRVVRIINRVVTPVHKIPRVLSVVTRVPPLPAAASRRFPRFRALFPRTCTTASTSWECGV